MKLVRKHIRTFEKFILNQKDPNKEQEKDSKKNKPVPVDDKDQEDLDENEDEDENEFIDEMKQYLKNKK